jgi:MFS family permease
MAISITYTDREKTIIYIAVLLGFMFDGYDLIITTFVLQPTAAYFHVGIPVVSFALSLMLISSVIGGIFYGWLADRIGRRDTLFITIFTYGIFTILSGASNSILELYLWRFLTGLGVGGEWGIGYSLLNEVYSEKTRGKAGGFVQSMFVFGSLAAAATSGYTLTVFGPALGWRYAYYIAGGAALTLGVIRFFMPESKIWLQYMKLKREGKLPPGFVVRDPFVSIFNKEYIRYTIFGSLLVIGNFIFAYSFLTFIPTYFGSVYKIPVATYSLMIILAQIVGIVGYVLCGFVSDLLGRRKTAIVYGLITFVAVLWFWYEATIKPPFVGPLLFPVEYAYMLIYFSAGFIAQYGVWIGEHYSTRMRATGSNFTYMIGRGLGAALPPIFVPLLMSTTLAYQDLGVAMSIGMLIGGIIQFIAIFGLKETKGTVITAI